MAHLNLGGILRARGDYAGSLALLRRGHELGSKQPGWPHPSGKWVAEAERRAALAERLTVVLKGESSPKDNAERLDLARMCYDTRRFAAAARFSAEAMEIDPKLGELDLPNLRAHGHPSPRRLPRRPGCCRSGRGRPAPRRGRQEPAPHPGPRLAPRRPRAVLEKTIVAYARGYNVGGLCALEGSAATWPAFRDATALSKLPEAERKEWQSLWAEFDALDKIMAP